MPPLSYLVQKVWAILLGDSELSLRHCGVLLFSLAVLLTGLAVGIACSNKEHPGNPCENAPWRTVGVLGAGLLLALNPTAMTYGVEIRAYPLLLFCSSASLLFLVLALRGESFWRTFLLCLSLAAAFFTHYFGVVLSGVILTAYFTGLHLSGRKQRPAIVLAVLLALCFLADIPFLLQAMHMSKGAAEQAVPVGLAAHLVSLLHLWARMMVHGAMLSYPHLPGVAVLSFTALFLLSLGIVSTVLRSLQVGLFAGLAVVAAASFVIHGFDPCSPSYNLWMPPILAAILGLALACSRGYLRWVILIFWGILIFSQGLTSVWLARHGELYAHGSSQQIEAVIHSVGSDRVTVLHAGDPQGFGKVFYPLSYVFGSTLRQYAVTKDNRLGDPRFNTNIPTIPISSIPTPFVLLLVSRDVDSAELAAYQQDHLLGGLDAKSTLSVLTSNGYRVLSVEDAPSLIGTRIFLLNRE